MLRIKEILKEKGITQTELAGTLGISQVGLNKLINGNPSLSSLERIATALNVSVKELFDDNPDDFITLYRKDEDGNFIEFGRVNKK